MTLKWKKCVHTGCHGTWHQNRSRWRSKNVMSCSWFTMRTLPFLCQAGHRRWVMVSLPHPWKEKAVHAVEAWQMLSAQEILDSSLCWQADGHGLLRHRGHPDGGVASSGDYSKHCQLLWHPHVLIGKSRNGAKTNGHRKCWCCTIMPGPTPAVKQHRWLAERCLRVSAYCPERLVCCIHHWPQWGVCGVCWSVIVQLSSPLSLYSRQVSIISERPLYTEFHSAAQLITKFHAFYGTQSKSSQQCTTLFL
jgi:hypothetical protein